MIYKLFKFIINFVLKGIIILVSRSLKIYQYFKRSLTIECCMHLYLNEMWSLAQLKGPSTTTIIPGRELFKINVHGMSHARIQKSPSGGVSLTFFMFFLIVNVFHRGPYGPTWRGN